MRYHKIISVGNNFCDIVNYIKLTGVHPNGEWLTMIIDGKTFLHIHCITPLPLHNVNSIYKIYT